MRLRLCGRMATGIMKASSPASAAVAPHSVPERKGRASLKRAAAVLGVAITIMSSPKRAAEVVGVGEMRCSISAPREGA